MLSAPDLDTRDAESRAVSTVLPRAEWHARSEAHAARADQLTAGWRARRQTGEKHPVEDFLFTYYSYKPALLRTWHPGVGVALEDAAAVAERRFYRVEDGVVSVDHARFLAQKAHVAHPALRILRLTAVREARLGCFGLHEWAMVYRQTDDDRRHGVPLRLGQRGTDEVVEANPIACSHFDAFRFFTPDAVPRNELQPTRETQPALEQPGCLHANMDVYKWFVKLGPLVPGEFLLDAFELARDIRELDMRASPYDLRDWGYEPVRIETSEGKRDYRTAQGAFSQRAQRLRRACLDSLAEVVDIERC